MPGQEFKSVTINGATDAYNVIKEFYSDDIGIYESFFILLLNRANKTIGWAKISQGGVCGTVVDIKIICKYVVDSLASAVILAHNHPSGTLRASQEDINVTKKITEALKYFDCKVMDHLILTPEGKFCSVIN